MKKKVVRALIFFVIALLAFSCQYTQSHRQVDMEAILGEYLGGEVLIPVEQAYALYDQDTSGVVFLDVRDATAFASVHEPGAVNIPAAQIGKLRQGKLPNHGRATYLVYSDQLQTSIDAWFVLKWNDVPDVRIVQGTFDPSVGMLMDVSMDPSIDYGAVFSGARERLTFKPPPPPPPPPVPKKTVQVQKKKPVVEEEEGC